MGGSINIIGHLNASCGTQRLAGFKHERESQSFTIEISDGWVGQLNLNKQYYIILYDPLILLLHCILQYTGIKHAVN